MGNPLSESTIRNFVKASQLYSQAFKEEIGQHAYQFGLESCLKLYQSKIPPGIELKRSMIKRFKDVFLAKNPNLPTEEEEDEGDENHHQKFLFEASLKEDIGRYAFHCGNTNAVHHFSSKLRFPMKESTIRKFKKVWMEKNGVDVIKPNDFVLDFTSNVEQSYMKLLDHESQSVPLPLTVNEKSIAAPEAEASTSAGEKATKKFKLRRRTAAKKKGSKNLDRTRSKRGQYVAYGAGLRAEIGKYATNHGNQETINFFRDKMGIELPESTVRGLRDRWLVLSSNQDASELALGRRGRPMRLGKYDATVQKCIRELVESGEKPTSFLAVATAKQVLMENDPGLLAENGGSVELNTTWAKSFLRRMKLGK